MTDWTIKCTLLLSVFYAFFLLFMRKTTFFRFNRAVLTGGTLVCLLLPFAEAYLPAPAAADFLPGLMLPEAVVGEDAAPTGSGWKILVLAVYATGCVVVAAAIVGSLLNMLKIFRHGEKVCRDGAVIHVVDADISSFSFMRHIVIGRGDFENHPEILLHESMHVRYGHSADLLFMSLVCVLQWFNPLVWLMRSEIRMLHEYEADEAVLNKGIDASQYQLLLVRKAVGDKRFLIANSFNHSKLKNRIAMMNTLKTKKWARLAYLACLPLLFGALCFCSGGNEKEKSGESRTEPAVQKTEPAVEQESMSAAQAAVSEPDDDVRNWNEVEVKPSFNGGGANEFALWVAQNVEYPKESYDAGISGRVYIEFEVGADGKVSEVKVLRGVSEDIDNEAVRVVSSSPEWTPGTIDGKPVAVRYTMPIIFQLRK